MRLLLGVAFWAVMLVAAFAASGTDQIWWHDPTILPSIDVAANDVTNSRPFLRERHSYKNLPDKNFFAIDNFIIERDGIGFVSSRTDTQVTSSWQPSWGGTWVGSTYVPYYGGTTVTTQTPRRTEATIWFAYRDVQQIFLAHMPKFSPWPWCTIARLDPPEGDVAPKTVGFCAGRADQVRKMYDALFTLVVSWSTQADTWNIGDFHWSAGALSSTDPEFDVQKRFKELGWPRTTGYHVGDVMPGSPAQAAGLRVDDIIFEAGGSPIMDKRDYAARIRKAAKTGKPYASIDLKVFRDGQEIAVKVDNLKDPYFGYERLRAAPAAGQAPQ